MVVSRRSLALGLVMLGACTAPAPSSTPNAPSPPRAETQTPAVSSEDAPQTPPTPEPSAIATAPTPIAISPRKPGSFANLDPNDDYVVGPPDEISDCEGELAKAGVRFVAARLPVHTVKANPKSKTEITCGAPQVVTYVRGPGNIAYEPAPLLTCGMALALASFEKIVQEEAERAFGSRVVSITQLGTYACRVVAAYPDTVSEHAYANAIDLSRFRLKNGQSVDVLHDFDQGEGTPTTRGGAFLRAISRRANDEDVFSHVLTPFFNAVHRNHFHLDLARFRQDGTRPQST